MTLLRRSRLEALTCAFALALAGTGIHAAQDDPHAAHRAHTAQRASGAATSVALPGTDLLQTEGRAFRLDAAAFGQRVVVIDFVFTSCTTICPLLNAVMASLQTQLGNRLGEDIVLVSISVDPSRDTPVRMSNKAREIGAGPNWIWLTGPQAEIDRTLRAFGLPRGRPEDHPPTILVGSPQRGEWLKWVGLPRVDDLAQAAREMADGAAHSPDGHGHAGHAGHTDETR